MIRKDFDRRAGEVSPAIDQRLNAPFRWFRHDNAARAMSRNGASQLGCEAAGIVGRVELYIINSETAFAERFGEVACKIACNIDPLRGLFASNSDPL